MPLSAIVVWNEIRKHFVLSFSYRLNIVATSVTAGFTFAAAMFLVGRGSFAHDSVSSSFIGYVVWFYAFVTVTQMGRNVAEEAQTGTLEQMFLSPVPPVLLLVGRAIGAMLMATIFAAPFAIALPLILEIELPLHWEVIPAAAITMAGLLGFGFALSGITLVVKRTAGIATLAQNALLFLSGALIPISQFPGWLQGFSKLLPITLGIELIRDLGLEDVALSQAWSSGSLPWLVAHSSVYLVIGIVIFRVGERTARRQGSLGAY